MVSIQANYVDGLLGFYSWAGGRDGGCGIILFMEYQDIRRGHSEVQNKKHSKSGGKSKWGQLAT